MISSSRAVLFSIHALLYQKRLLMLQQTFLESLFSFPHPRVCSRWTQKWRWQKKRRQWLFHKNLSRRSNHPASKEFRISYCILASKLKWVLEQPCIGIEKIFCSFLEFSVNQLNAPHCARLSAYLCLKPNHSSPSFWRSKATLIQLCNHKAISYTPYKDTKIEQRLIEGCAHYHVLWPRVSAIHCPDQSFACVRHH